MKTYVARFEKDGRSWHISVPEVAGCRTHAVTVAQGMKRIREALSLYVQGEYDVVPEMKLESVTRRPKRTGYAQSLHEVWDAYRAARDAMETLEQALGRLPKPAPPKVKK